MEIGSQTKSHPHMHRLSEDEIRKEINYSNNRFKQELNEIPILLLIHMRIQFDRKKSS